MIEAGRFSNKEISTAADRSIQRIRRNIGILIGQTSAPADNPGSPATLTKEMAIIRPFFAICTINQSFGLRRWLSLFGMS
jgi:hypothetical protein